MVESTTPWPLEILDSTQFSATGVITVPGAITTAGKSSMVGSPTALPEPRERKTGKSTLAEEIRLQQVAGGVRLIQP